MSEVDNINSQELIDDSVTKRKHDEISTVEDEDKISKLNPLRCPFSETTSVSSQTTRQSKRTQRYRSTAQSRLGDMTVGDIRYCFQQLRNAGDDLNPEMMLYNGQCAGEFALKYLTETSNAMRKRRKKTSSKQEEVVIVEKEPEVLEFPESQLPPPKEDCNTNVLKF